MLMKSYWKIAAENRQKLRCKLERNQIMNARRSHWISVAVCMKWKTWKNPAPSYPNWPLRPSRMAGSCFSVSSCLFLLLLLVIPRLSVTLEGFVQEKKSFRSEWHVFRPKQRCNRRTMTKAIITFNFLYCPWWPRKRWKPPRHLSPPPPPSSPFIHHGEGVSTAVEARRTKQRDANPSEGNEHFTLEFKCPAEVQINNPGRRVLKL